MDEPPTLAGELATALKALQVDERDRPTVLLAMRYAAAIDRDSDLLDSLGSKLMTALVQLQLTPASRNTAGAGAQPKSPAVAALDELRAKRQQRAGSG
jgi:hypothetical protein